MRFILKSHAFTKVAGSLQLSTPIPTLNKPPDRAGLKPFGRYGYYSSYSLMISFTISGDTLP